MHFTCSYSHLVSDRGKFYHRIVGSFFTSSVNTPTHHFKVLDFAEAIATTLIYLFQLCQHVVH